MVPSENRFRLYAEQVAYPDIGLNAGIQGRPKRIAPGKSSIPGRSIDPQGRAHTSAYEKPFARMGISRRRRIIRNGIFDPKAPSFYFYLPAGCLGRSGERNPTRKECRYQQQKGFSHQAPPYINQSKSRILSSVFSKLRIKNLIF
jgi:hypothetical protein